MNVIIYFRICRIVEMYYHLKECLCVSLNLIFLWFTVLYTAIPCVSQRAFGSKLTLGKISGHLIQATFSISVFLDPCRWREKFLVEYLTTSQPNKLEWIGRFSWLAGSLSQIYFIAKRMSLPVKFKMNIPPSF